MQARAFNPQVFLEFLSHCVFGGLLLHLVRSGKYLSYVTPRMEPYLYFTVIIMVIWALAGLGRLFRPQHKIRSAHCFVLVIPVLLLLLPHSPLGVSDLSSLSDTAGNQPPPADMAATDSIDEVIPDTQTNAEEEALTELPGLDAANKKIIVSNEDFGMWYSELYMNTENYEGYTIVVTGYVFKDSEILKKDEFVSARLMMSCCVADLSPAGLLCKYDKASELEADSWVTVEGTLHIVQYEYSGETYDDPQISVKKITPAKEVEGYVYPYF